MIGAHFWQEAVRDAKAQNPMIDTHNHILPGLDDGADSLEETLEMCRIAAEDGIQRVVATPHTFDGEFVNHVDDVRLAVRELNVVLSSQQIPVQILPGMELRISADIGVMLEEGKILTLNDSKFVLLEFHPTQLPVGFINLADQLISNGYSPIIAHPEKNAAIQRNPEVLFHWVTGLDYGRLLVQISADSLVGQSGYRAARTAKILLKNNLVHLIASDAHSPRTRPPRLSEAVQAAARIVGRENAAKMVNDVPQAVIDGGEVPDLGEPTNPRRWWRVL